MAGDRFGRYVLEQRLGQGGMGEVWRAHDTVLERPVALKLLLPTFADDTTFTQRFHREARVAARLDSPHVVPIYDVGDVDGRLFLSMRLIDGQPLDEVIARGPMDPARAVAIVGQIARGLQAAHDVGLVHRDVKPSNMLLDRNDHAYLIDFGIARAATDTKLTSTGMTIGTWSYMAPERFRGIGDVEAASDTYALACVLHECLTGQPPFPGDTFERVASGHMFDPPPRPSLLRAGIPDALDHVVAVGLAKDPAQRYRSVREFADAAQAALMAGSAPSPHPPAAVTQLAATQWAAPSTPAPHTPPVRRVAPPAPASNTCPSLKGPAVLVVLAGLVGLYSATFAANFNSEPFLDSWVGSLWTYSRILIPVQTSLSLTWALIAIALVWAGIQLRKYRHLKPWMAAAPAVAAILLSLYYIATNYWYDGQLSSWHLLWSFGLGLWAAVLTRADAAMPVSLAICAAAAAPLIPFGYSGFEPDGIIIAISVIASLLFIGLAAFTWTRDRVVAGIFATSAVLTTVVNLTVEDAGDYVIVILAVILFGALVALGIQLLLRRRA